MSRPSLIQVSEERDEEYEVDYIIASHIYRHQLQYLVHWKGYEEHERTWEPASNVKNAPLAVERFYKENPSAPWKLHMAQLDFDSLFTVVFISIRKHDLSESNCWKSPSRTPEVTVRCHAPNTFGTVNMEHTIDSSLSWSKR